MKKNYIKFYVFLFLFCANSLFSQAIMENFDNITTLPGSGWVLQNNSTPVGSTNWFQGTSVSGGGPFDAYNGVANAYIGANYNNTGNTGTISNWLMTPNRTFRNGDVITFYTRKVSPDTYADRLEVRLSTNGASTSSGSGATVGDYTTLLLSVNPSLALGVYPVVWTKYTITISGLAAPTSGRVAFRYFVTGGGLAGSSSDYIGIDAFTYEPYACPSFTMTAGGALAGGTTGSTYSTTLTQTGALGAPNFAITAGSLPPGLTLATAGTISGTPTATGTFNFTATVSDASGCSGSQAYSITVGCAANPISILAFPTLCSNGSPYTLMEASPAGGTYSGTGVSGGQFDPAAGTQTITYDYTDAYGCAFSLTKTITVNSAPSVTTSPSSTAICAGADTSFSAVASDATGYQWQVNTGSGFINVTDGVPYSGATIATLTITGAMAGMNGYAYRVLAAGQTGCNPATSGSATLTVNSSPSVSSQPVATTSCAGSAASFSAIAANASGYQWQVNTGSGFDNVSNGAPYSGATTAMLSISTTTAAMNGYIYRLVLSGTCTPAVTSDAVALTVSTVSAPTGSATQTFNAGNNLNVLVVVGQNIKWYASAADATNHVNVLPNTTVIVNNTTYYATQTVSTCESETSLAVKAYNESLAVTDNASKINIQLYPNPVKEILNLSGQDKINKIVIMSLDGKRVIEKEMNGDRQLNVHSLSQGTYLITVFTEKGVQTIKFIKH